jgi:hypothetical protein
LLAVVIEHMPLELYESVVDLMGRDSGGDLIDVCSGQGVPSSSVNHCGEIQFSEGVVRIPAQLRGYAQCWGASSAAPVMAGVSRPMAE